MNNQAAYLAKLYSMHHILNENNNNFKNSNKKLKQNFESFQKQNQLKINNMVNMISLNANVNNLSIKTQQGITAAPNFSGSNGSDSTFASSSVLSNESSTEDLSAKPKQKPHAPNPNHPRVIIKGALNAKNKVKINLSDFSPLVINSKVAESGDSSNGENESMSNDEESEKFESILKTVSTAKKVASPGGQSLNILPNKITSQISSHTPTVNTTTNTNTNTNTTTNTTTANTNANNGSSIINGNAKNLTSAASYLNKQFSSTIDGKKLADKNSNKAGNKDFQLVVSQIAAPNSSNESPNRNGLFFKLIFLRSKLFNEMKKYHFL